MKYTCGNCKETFESERPDDDARQEFADIWGGEPTPDRADIVCEPCFNKLIQASAKGDA